MYKFPFFLRDSVNCVTIRVLQISASIFYTHGVLERWFGVFLSFVLFGIYFRYLLTQKINLG